MESKNLRIIHVISSLNPANGGPMEALRLLSYMHIKYQTTMEIVCLDDPTEVYLKEYPVKVHALGKARFTYSFSLTLYFWLKKNHKNYDAVIINGLWQFHSLATLLAVNKKITPYFIFPHGMLNPRLKELQKLKFIKKRLYWLFFEYHVLRNAKAVLFTNLQEMVLASYCFKPYKYINPKYINYAADRSPYDPKTCRMSFYSNFPNTESKQNILFLGRIHLQKGCDILIKAFAKISFNNPNLHLIMAGNCEPSLLLELKKIAKTLGISDRIEWIGPIYNELKWGAFYASELFILPSHGENFGIAIAEALGSGLPVLITDKVNIYKVIEKYNAGYIAAVNLADIEEKLNIWLISSEQERLIMSRQATLCYEENFTPEEFYKSLIYTIKDGYCNRVIAPITTE